MKPDTWNGYRNIDEKIDFEALNKRIEEAENIDLDENAAALTAQPTLVNSN